MSKLLPTIEELKRKALFVPCKDEDALHRWVLTYLGLDIPNGLVDPDSNTSPMGVMWELYSALLKGDRPEFTRILTFASRDSLKSLSASILEILSVLHCERSVAHMAAIKEQAKVVQRYIKNFLNRPFLRDFVVSKNDTEIEVLWFEGKNGERLNDEEWKKLDQATRDTYIEVRRFIKIVIATLQGANGLHAPFMCVEGDTEILVEGNPRPRATRTVKSIFLSLEGKNPTGRRGDPTEPKEIVPVQEVNVLSLNLTTGLFEFSPIVRAHVDLKDTIRIETGRKSITCTLDHPLFVLGKGFTEAYQIKKDDQIVAIGKTHTSAFPTDIVNSNFKLPQLGYEDEWEQVLLGSLMGDCGIYKKPTNNPYIAEQHCLEQKEYLEWKVSILRNKIRMRWRKAVSGYTGDEMIGISSGNSPILLPYKDIRNDLIGLEKLGALGLAVWYMDDGCAGNGFRLSTEGWSKELNGKISIFLNERFGMNTNVSEYSREDKTYYYINGGVAAKRILSEICKKWIHPSMVYKFDVSENQKKCKFCNQIYWMYEAGLASQNCGSVICRGLQHGRFIATPVMSIISLGPRWVYDFTLDKNHNFFGNGLLNKQCVDEVDVVRDKQAYEEAKLIPSAINGKPAITLLTSTRKFSFGLVQREIDEATVDPNNGQPSLHIRHWNIIDMTERCPTSRHLPELPRIPIFVNDKTLRAVNQANYDLLDNETKKNWVKEEGFEGCLRNCSLFAACRGRLPNQQSTSKLLKPLADVVSKFKSTSPEMANAQLLCRKPSTEGLVYPNFNKEIHMLTAYQMARKILGANEPIPEKLDKPGLIQIMKDRQLPFGSGMDFGYTHNFAVVTGALDGQNFYGIDVIEVPELEDEQKVDICNGRIKHLNPTLFPDPEAPSSIATFKRRGYRVKEVNKYAGSVVAGIEIIRRKLMPSIGLPTLFFLKGDEGCESVAKRFSTYHWKLDAAGRPTDIPDEEADDSLDALRYAMLSLFDKKGKLTTAPDKQLEKPVPTQQQYNQTDWMKKQIALLTGNSSEDGMLLTPKEAGGVINHGSLVFDFTT